MRARWRFYHDRHHQTYVTNLNNAVKDHSSVASMPLQDILARLGEMPEAIRTALRNSGGGHANHTMFWKVMGPGGGKPGSNLAAAIDRDLGGVQKFQDDFNAAGARVFGSGWVFVTVSKEGKLAIETRPNQDTPLMDGKRVLLGNDVWEHAYYLTYQNRRAGLPEGLVEHRQLDLRWRPLHLGHGGYPDDLNVFARGHSRVPRPFGVP